MGLATQSELSILVKSSQLEIDPNEVFRVNLNCGKFGVFHYDLTVNQKQVLSVDEMTNVTCRITMTLSENQELNVNYVVGDDQGASNGFVSGTPAKEFNNKTIWVELVEKTSIISSSTSDFSSVSTTEQNSTIDTTSSTSLQSNSDSTATLSSVQSSLAITTQSISTSSLKLTTNSFTASKTISYTSSVESTKSQIISKSSSSRSSKSSKVSSTISVTKSSKSSIISEGTLINSAEEIDEEVESSTTITIDPPEPTEEEILGIVDDVNKKIGYREQNYWYISGAVAVFLLSITTLLYYLKKNYYLLKFQNHESHMYKE